MVKILHGVDYEVDGPLLLKPVSIQTTEVYDRCIFVSICLR